VTKNLIIGESESILLKAKANAESINRIATAIEGKGSFSQDAVSLSVAEKYVDAFAQIAKEGNTVIIPSNPSDVASLVAQGMAIFKQTKK
jgi:hypothetical protein